METEKRFETKTGYCHILPDRIVLTRDGIVGNVATISVGNTIYRILFIYGLLCCVLIYGMYDLFLKGHFFLLTIYGLIVLYLVYGIIRSFNNSATPLIERSRIRKVRFIKGIPGLSRSRFEIKFEDDSGKIKKRLIMLPGSATGGKKETERALDIMKEEKLI